MILDVLARQVTTRGDRVFLRHEGRAVTYAEFDKLANRAANALRDLDVEPGERVTLALGNSIEYVVAAFGVLRAGAILNPVNPGLGASELAYILKHCEPQVVVTDAASDETMRGLGVPTVLATTLAADANDGPVGVAVD